MAYQDWFTARARVSNKPHKNVTLDDKSSLFHQLSMLVSSGTPLPQAIQICAEQSQSVKLQAALADIAGRMAAGNSLYAAAAMHSNIFQRRWLAMIRTGEITGQMGMALAELSKQLMTSPPAPRRSLGILKRLVFGAVLVAICGTALFWMSSQRCAIFAYGRAANAKAANSDLAALVLNATCIMGYERLAIINGKAYRLKDKFSGPGDAATSYIVSEILPDKVVLKCQGKSVQLGYANTSTAAKLTKGADKPIEKDVSLKGALPSELAPATGKEHWTKLLEKAQQGTLSLEDAMTVLSSKKE